MRLQRIGRFGPYRQLLREYLAPQGRAVALMAALLLASIGLQLIGPQVARRFIDGAQAGASESVLVRVALAFIGVSVAQQAVRVLAAYWSERVAWTATNALRADLAAHLVGLDMGFHTSRTPGELIERVDGDVNALAGFFSSFVIELLGSALLLTGALVALALVDARLGLAFGAYAALALGLLGWVRRFATLHWRADRERSAAFFGYVGELLAATEDIRSSGAVPYAMRRFFEHLRGWLPTRVRAELGGSAVWMAAVALFALGDAIAYGLGGGLYRGGAISLGAVYLVVAYIAMLAAPIETIRTQLQDLQRADAGIARVRELLDLRSRLEDGDQTLPQGALAVEFDGVRFSYGDHPLSVVSGQLQNPIDSRSIGIGNDLENTTDNGQRTTDNGRRTLDDISFHLAAGRTLGLLGRTGSGKSTIARLLFRLYDPQAGAVRLGGVDLRQAGVAALRSRIGLVTQDVQLFEASLRDNITFFDPDVSDAFLLVVLETLGMRPWLERLPDGLDTIIAGSRLSAGEAQLIAFARVFIKDPGLVILDEASSRLDPATEALLERALDRLLEGRTAVIIAHRLATLARADEIRILDDGRILDHGPREELAADPRSRFAQLARAGLGEVVA